MKTVGFANFNKVIDSSRNLRRTVDRKIHDARWTEKPTSHGGQTNPRRTVDRGIHDARWTVEFKTYGGQKNPRYLVDRRIYDFW